MSRTNPLLWLIAIPCILGLSAIVIKPRTHAMPMGAGAGADGWYEGATGYAAALADQEKSGAPMLLYFHTDWCGYCKKFERDLLPRADVQERMRAIVKVRLNPERSRDEHALGAQYNVRGFPSLFLLKSSGAPAIKVPLFTQSGSGWIERTPAEFIALLQ